MDGTEAARTAGRDSMRGKPEPTEVLALRILVKLPFWGDRSWGFVGGLGWGCAVLRTASASISRSSALVLAGWRVDFHRIVCHRKGMPEGELNPAGPLLA
jgi:hypothetical protein